MLKEIYTAALGMMPQQTKLEIVANNIANANTAGFKREGVFEQTLIQAKQNMYGIQGEVEQSDPPMKHFADFTQGALEKTDNQFDIAIDGKGFFTLQDSEGNEFYTRSGHFMLLPDGRLGTPDGKVLVGDSGAFQIRDNTAHEGFVQDEQPLELRVKETGEIAVNNQSLGKLQLVDIENPQTLTRQTATQFKAGEETITTPIEEGNMRVKQGHIENSNVNIIAEMVNMIQLQKFFDLGQKVIQSNDGTLDRSIELSRYS